MRHIIKPMRDSAERRGWSGTEEVGISSEFVVEIDRNGWIFEKKGIGFGCFHFRPQKDQKGHCC